MACKVYLFLNPTFLLSYSHPFPLTLTVCRGRDPSPHASFRLLWTQAHFQHAHFFRGRASALLLMFKHHRLNPGNDWMITVIKERWPLAFSPLLQNLRSCRGLYLLKRCLRVVCLVQTFWLNPSCISREEETYEDKRFCHNSFIRVDYIVE